MAAKKKAKKTITRAADLDTRDVRMSDMTPAEQREAVGLVSERSMQTRQSLKKAGNPNWNKAVNKPVTLDSMTNTRVRGYKEAYTSPTKLPHETYAGEDFYFDHRGQIDEPMKAVGSTLPIDTVASAAGTLSVRNDPKLEKATLGAMVRGQAQGKVHFSPQFVESVKGYDATTKDVVSGKKPAYDVPSELVGTTKPMRELPGHVVAAASSKQAREAGAQAHVTGVDLDQMGKTGMHGNRSSAWDTLVSGGTLDPHKTPKQASYAQAHVSSAPNTPEHREWKLRTGHIGAVLRGEVAGSQGMFDFEGLRSSNEGVLSNEHPTAEDSWMIGVSYDQPNEVLKATGDNRVTTKGRKKSKTQIAPGDTRFNKGSIEHAVHHEATVRAAKQVQKDLDLDFTVPSLSVQEGTWANKRRSTGDDADYNDQMKALEEARNPKKDKNAPKLIQEHPTESMPGLNWDQFKS